MKGNQLADGKKGNDGMRTTYALMVFGALVFILGVMVFPWRSGVAGNVQGLGSFKVGSLFGPLDDCSRVDVFTGVSDPNAALGIALGDETLIPDNVSTVSFSSNGVSYEVQLLQVKSTGEEVKLITGWLTEKRANNLHLRPVPGSVTIEVCRDEIR